MKKITLVGAVDKRFIAYHLMHIISLLGKTLVVTDDTSFLRFEDGDKYEFEVGTAHIYVRMPLTEDLIREVANTANEPFEYIVVVSNNFVFPDSKVVLVSSISRGLDNSGYNVDERVKQFEGATQVTLVSGKVKELEGLKVVISDKLINYVYTCEDHKRFFPLQDEGVVAMITKLFGDELELPAGTVKKMLDRRS